MPRIPLHVPVPLRLTPAVLFALETLLHDPVTADRFEGCLEDQGVPEDATEDALDGVLAEVRRAVGEAMQRPAGRRVVPKVHVRPVTPTGSVVVGGRVYRCPELDDHKGDLVKCRLVGTDEGRPAARVTTFGEREIGLATLVGDRRPAGARPNRAA